MIGSDLLILREFLFFKDFSEDGNVSENVTKQ